MDSPLLENIRSRHWKKKQKKPTPVTIEEGKIPIRVTWPDSVTDICPLLSNLSWRRSVRHQSRYRRYLNSNNSSQTPSSLQISSQQQKHNKEEGKNKKIQFFFSLFHWRNRSKSDGFRAPKHQEQSPETTNLRSRCFFLPGLLDSQRTLEQGLFSSCSCSEQWQLLPSPFFLFIWDFLLWVFGFLSVC